MKLMDILMMAFGGLISALGCIRIIGSVWDMLDPTSTTRALEHVGIVTFLGLVPMVAGALLLYRAYARSIQSERERAERGLLRMAEDRGGRLTAAEVASHSSYTVDEASKLLEGLHARGAAEMRVSDGGAIVFRFPGFVDEDARSHAEGYAGDRG